MIFSQGHALIIGVSEYKHTPKRSVPNVFGDAEVIAQVLRDPQRCGYPAEQVTVLTKAEANRRAILDAFDNLAKRVQPRDTAFLFYAGHGDYGDDKAYYLTTCDTQLEDGKVIKKSGIRQDELLTKIKAIPAQRMLLVFNACHSGEIAPEALGDQDAASREDFGNNLPDEIAGALLAAGEGRIIITACRATEKSYFLRGAPTTIFAQCLRDGLMGDNIRPRKGAIGVFDLYAYVFDGVSGDVRRRFELSQEPELTVSKGVGVMAVALYQGQQAQGDLDRTDRPGSLGGSVREFDEQQSQELFEKVVNLRIEAVGRDKISAGRDYFAGPAAVARDVRGNQVVGGRDAAGRDMRKGDDISVGNITGSSGIAVGRGASAHVSHSGPGARTYFDAPTESTQAPVSLSEGVAEVRRAEEQARSAGLSAVSRTLRGIAETLEDALQAEVDQNITQRTKLLQRAFRDLEELAIEDMRVNPLLEILKRVV